MVYNCQICGAWFPKDLLMEAMSSSAKIISCPYCGNVNEMEQVKTSHVSEGYKHLESGDFHAASMEFGVALKRVDDRPISAKAEFLDVYLGRALAQYSAQVIYDGEIADVNEDPEINCYRCNDSYFEESHDYQTALEIARNILHDDLRATTIARVTRFAKKIDGIKRVYDRKMANREEVQLFIACEDDTKDSAAGLTVAHKIRDYLPSAVNKVYVQDPFDKSFEEYEGELLYAIHNAPCMLVVIDNDVDERLQNLYSRYYWVMKEALEKSLDKKHLGFVRYKDKVPVTLPEHKIATDVFELEEKTNITKFVGDSLKIDLHLDVKSEKEKQLEKEREIEITTRIEESTRIREHCLDKGAPIDDGFSYRFGTYPQRQLTEHDGKIYNEVMAEFTKEPKPNASNSNGWEVMFTSKTGQPYTWYKDKVVGEKKYRAVFFTKFREVFTVRPTDIMPSVQRVSKFTPMRIYIFSFDEIEWNALYKPENKSADYAILIPSMALDCREFNNCQLSSDWECASIRNWLNEDFYRCAFTDEQKKFMWKQVGDESVRLLDQSVDFSIGQCIERLNSYNISGSDYFRCIGGFCDKNISISTFWINGDTDNPDRAAAVQPHNVCNIVPQCVDSTAVSVLPVIKVELT